MAKPEDASRLDFLYKASHIIFAHSPELSRFYMSEFQDNVRLQDIPVAKAIVRRMCPRCGQIYAPGLNTTVFLERQKRRKKKRNYLVYQCDACGLAVKRQGSYPNVPKASSNQLESSSSLPTVAEPVNNDNNQKKKKNKKKKNNKKNNLLDMLASRKQNEEEKSMGLNDFLSSLWMYIYPTTCT